MHYQTHDASERGMSNSAAKLERLRLPSDLRGKAVLDIGCSEGFFCNVAAQRGATRIVGLDLLESNIQFARSRYTHPAIEFRQSDWKTLPEGLFDFVLWTSAMHYEQDPKSVLTRVHALLAPQGTLVLECGIAGGIMREMVMHARSGDTCWYPTERYLIEVLLENFAARRVSWPALTPGDPVARSVFHAKRRLPTVMLFRGLSQQGKSNSAQSMAASATQVISLDVWVMRAKTAAHHQNEVQKFIRDHANSNNLLEFYRDIDAAELTQQYARLLARSVAASDHLVVIEGFMTEAQAEALVRELDGHAIVWDAERLTRAEFDRMEQLWAQANADAT